MGLTPKDFPAAKAGRNTSHLARCRMANPERFGENMSTTPSPTPTPPAAPPAASTDPATPPVTDPVAPPPAGDLGDAGKKALQIERDARKKAEDDFKALQQQIADSQKTAEQKAAEALSAAQASANEASSRALRYEVAAEKGLDLALAARLSGSTKEELEADADALMTLIPKAPEASAPVPPAGPTVPGQQPGGQPQALITQADLDALGAAGKYEEVNRLRREGRLSHLGVAPPKAR